MCADVLVNYSTVDFVIISLSIWLTYFFFVNYKESAVAVGPDSTRTTCPSCHAAIATRVDHESSAKTHIIAGLLCLFVRI